MLLKLLLFQFVLEATVVDVVGVLVPIGNIDLDDGVVVAPKLMLILELHLLMFCSCLSCCRCYFDAVAAVLHGGEDFVPLKTGALV